MSLSRALFVSLVLASTLSGALGAAGSAVAAGEPNETRPVHSLCWRGRPLPECRFFILTEMGVYARLDHDPTHGSSTPYFTMDVGLMRNRTPEDAVGGTIYLAAGSDHARVGARLRYRKWLSRTSSVDFAPGLIAYGSEDGGYAHRFPGFVGGVSLNLGDLVGVGVEAEHARYRSWTDGVPNVSDTTWRAGAKLGSAPGVVGAVLLVGFIVAVVAASAD